MNEHQLKGTFGDVAGKVQSAAGAIADDPANELKGKAREASGKIQAGYGEAVAAANRAGQSLGQAIQSNPLAAVAVAGAVGFALGWILRRG